MEASRLFIALCRAANVPARSVWGIVNAHDDIGGYNNHHQWAESLDESGYWHAMDFGYTIDFDLNDIRYLDMIYAAEENKIRFRLLSDSRPDSMVVEYS